MAARDRNLGLEVAEEQVSILRRCGYPEAYAEREYCTSEITPGSDNLIIQASIRLGPYREDAIPVWMRDVIAKARTKK